VPQTEAFEPTLFGAASAFANIDSLLILACGTSYYSGLTAKYWLESIANPDPGGDRQRIPLPRVGAEPARSWW
jgi:hypothetical protein